MPAPIGFHISTASHTVYLNATTHGLFSKVIVLAHESHDEFDDLLAGLRQDLRPEGTIEEVLVEKIGTLLWRHRRLFNAESAEIQLQLLEQLHRDNERRAERQAEVPQSLEIDDPPQSLKAISSLVPLRSYGIDRLLRYETHLDRAFTRALEQLELLQRRRECQDAITISH